MTSKLNRTSQAGFTLVELAIVLMIIGLLIGGILRGQELMENARVTSTIQQTKAYDGATTTFRDSYNAIPGDIGNPGARLPNCGAGTNCVTYAGNSNGIVGVSQANTTGTYGAMAAGESGEGRGFWIHLATARLISGINPETTNNTSGIWGDNFPAAKIAGGFHIAQFNVPAAGSTPAISGLYLILRNAANTFANVVEGEGVSAISPTRAAQIDRKMDDGQPNIGDVIARGTNCASNTDVNGTYNETQEQRNCNLMIRVQS